MFGTINGFDASIGLLIVFIFGIIAINIAIQIFRIWNFGIFQEVITQKQSFKTTLKKRINRLFKKYTFFKHSFSTYGCIIEACVYLS